MSTHVYSYIFFFFFPEGKGSGYLKLVFQWIFPTKITFSMMKSATGAAVNTSWFARKTLHPDNWHIHMCYFPKANFSKPPFFYRSWNDNLMCSFPVGIFIAFSGGLLMACLPRCSNRGKIILGVCKGSPVMCWPYIYLWRSERNVRYLWTYFLSLKGSTWTETKLFPCTQNWSANGSLLCFCTPTIMWLHLKRDPGHPTDSWGCP